MYILYYIYIKDTQYGVRYIIGISRNFESRITGYIRRHTIDCKVCFLYEFKSKREALDYETLIKYAFWQYRRAATTEEYNIDILSCFNLP